MARFKRVLRYMLLALLCALLLMVGLLGWGLASESGSRWLVARATGFVPGTLKIDQVAGRIGSDLTLTRIHYRRDQLTVDGESLQLQWQPKRLFAGELSIGRMALVGFDLHLPAQSDAEQSATDSMPFTLPQQIDLPLAVDIQSLGIERARIYASTGEMIQQLDAAQLGLRVREGRIELKQLVLRAPQGALELTGSSRLGAGFPIDLASSWQLRLPQGANGAFPPQPLNLHGEGRLSGNLDQLVLQQSMSGAIDADLQVHLDNPLSKVPTWDAQFDLTGLDIAALLVNASPELLALAPSGRLQAEGDLKSAQVELVLRANLPELQLTTLNLTASATPERIEVKQLSLQPELGDARFDAYGSVDDPLGTGRLDAKVSWQSLRFPLAGQSPLLSSEQGELFLKGFVDNYDLSLNAQIKGADIPETHFTLTGQGDLEGIDLQRLSADTLGGSIGLTGRVGWAPYLQWNLEAVAQGVQPETQWPQIPGTVDAKINTQGALDEQLVAQVVIDQLGGELQGQRLSGSGQVQVSGSAITLEQVDLGWGASRLRASGEIADRLAVQWDLNVPDLGALLPDARGSIQGRGRLSGARQLPAIDADLELSELQYQGNRVGQLDARLVFDPGWNTPANIRLQARQVESAGQAINSVELRVTGNDRRLDIQLDADAGRTGSLSLHADGQLTTDLQQTPVQWAWGGRLTQLDLVNPQTGRWAMTAPTPVEAAPDRYRLATLCLASADIEGQACIEGEGGAGNMSGSARIEALSLALLAPFIPEPTVIQGQVDGQAQFSLQEGISRYSAQVDLPQAALSLPGSELNLTLDNSQLTLKGNQDAVDASVDIRMAPLEGGVQGTVSIRDLTGARRLGGDLTARVERLQPLALLLPQIQIQQGSADASLTFAGSLQQPDLRGQLALTDGDLELPAAGIRISAIDLNIEDDPEQDGQMLVVGSARSGRGNLALNGRLIPMEKSAELTLKGERFEAVNTAEVQVDISPDLQLTLSPESVRVRGELVIPAASIQAPKLEQGAVAASPDLVMRSEMEATGSRGPSMDIDLRVVLGESVNVDAFGFKGRLIGALNLLQQGSGLARGTGSVGVAEGQYRLYGQDLNISRGNLIFTGGLLSNPGLDLRVGREVDDVVVGALVSGSLRNPALRLTSSPAMPDNRILSYLVLGRAPDSTSAGEQQMLMKLALSLGAKGGTSLTEKLTRSLNVDEIGIASGDTVDDTSFYIGKYLSPDLYIKYGIGLVNPINTFLMRYQLSKRLALETETSAEGSGGDLIYSFER